MSFFVNDDRINRLEAQVRTLRKEISRMFDKFELSSALENFVIQPVGYRPTSMRTVQQTPQVTAPLDSVVRAILDHLDLKPELQPQTPATRSFKLVPKEKRMEDAKQLEPHQLRVVAEYEELKEKHEKLLAFEGTPMFTSLHRAEQTRLIRQANAMREYMRILSERIDAFSNPETTPGDNV